MDIKKLLQSRLVQILATAVLAFGLGILFWAKAEPAGNMLTGAGLNIQVSQDAEKGFSNMGNIQAAYQDISSKTLPAVVEIDVMDVVNQQREFRQQGLGSGFIVRQVDDKVYVLTNYHVVDNATEISVATNDKRRFSATVVGKDERRDLALVMFKSSDKFTLMKFGDSSQVQVGDFVFAMGSPLGFDASITQGIISAVGRKTQPDSGVSAYTDYFQTDAAINQGNSGGPLVNVNSEVIGINTWIATNSGGSVGLGFAIPVNYARQAVDDLITKGSVTYGWLGIAGNDLNNSIKNELGMGGRSGSFVAGVYKATPAFNAGILPGDVITKVNGQDIPDLSQLQLSIGGLAAGASAHVTLVRNGRQVELDVTISTKPEDKSISASDLWPGFSVVTVTPDIRNRLGLPGSQAGLVVGSVEQNSRVQTAGIRTGDIVRSVNGRDVYSMPEFYAALNDQSSQDIMFGLSRESRNLSIGVAR